MFDYAGKYYCNSVECNKATHIFVLDTGFERWIEENVKWKELTHRWDKRFSVLQIWRSYIKG
jgi:hypothetical protein